MSTDAQTQAIPRISAAAIPRVSTAVIAATDAEIVTPAPAPAAESAATGRDTEKAAPQAAASAPDVEVAGEKQVQQLYEAAMARLNALHDNWAAAIVELRETQVDSGPGEAAA